MYCSSCGSAIAPGLSYCNRCGAELIAKKPNSAKRSDSAESLVWAIVAVSVGGLPLIIALIAVMKNELHFDNQLILLFSLLSFLPLLLAEIVFIWLLMSNVRRSRKREQETDAINQVKGSSTKELGEARERFFDQPELSVAEHTTRSMETAARERKPD